MTITVPNASPRSRFISQVGVHSPPERTGPRAELGRESLHWMSTPCVTPAFCGSVRERSMIA